MIVFANASARITHVFVTDSYAVAQDGRITVAGASIPPQGEGCVAYRALDQDIPMQDGEPDALRSDLDGPLEELDLRPTTISKLEFLQRLTAEEVAYLWSAPQYAPLVAQVLAAEVVDLADETSQYARQALAAAEVDGERVFSDERLAEIFAVEG